MPLSMRACTALSMLCVATQTATVHADTFFGLYVGAHAWNGGASGDFESTGESNIDLEDTLDVSDETLFDFYAAVEHPLPLIPNIRVAQSDMLIEQSTNIGADITFQNTDFTLGETLDYELDLTHTDATLYYEVLDNWITLDLGLTARRFTGEIIFESLSTRAEADISKTLTMLYGVGQVELPFTGFHVRAELNAEAFERHDHTEANLSVGYESALGLGWSLGYRIFSFKLEELSQDNVALNLDSDFQLSGVYFGINYHL